MPSGLELLLEAERRGILPDNKKGLLAEARQRGLVPASQVEGLDPQNLKNLAATEQKIQGMERSQDPVTWRGVPQNPTAGSGKRFVEGLVKSFDPRGLVQAVASPIETAKGLVSAQGEQLQKSGEAFGEGRYSEALGHGVAGALPVVGPGAAAIGEQIGGGDVAGGLGAAMASVLPSGALAGARATKIPAALKRSAQRQYGQALRATKETMKRRSARVVPKLIERGATGSRAKLLKTAESKAAKALEELKEAEARIPAGTKIKIEGVVDWLEKKKDSLTGARTKDGIIGNEAGVNSLTRLQEQIIDLGDDVPYETLVRVRRVLDREVAEAGGFFGKSLKDASKLSAKQEAANSIRRELGKARPDIARINAEFSLWKTTGEILEETAQRTQGQSTPLGQQLAQAAGGGGGLAVGAASFGTGGAIGGAVGGALLFKGVKALVESPSWKTISAVKKNRLADAIVSGRADLVAKTAGAILLGGQGDR